MSKSHCSIKLAQALSMGDESLTPRPAFIFGGRECIVNGADGAFCPASLLGLRYFTLNHGLDEAMDLQSLVVLYRRSDEREAASVADQRDEAKLIFRRGSESLSQDGAFAVGEDLLGDGVGGEEGAEAEEVARGSVLFCDFAKGESEGDGDRRVVAQRAAFGQESRFLRRIETRVFREAELLFFDVGPGLVEGEEAQASLSSLGSSRAA